MPEHVRTLLDCVCVRHPCMGVSLEMVSIYPSGPAKQLLYFRTSQSDSRLPICFSTSGQTNWTYDFLAIAVIRNSEFLYELPLRLVSFGGVWLSHQSLQATQCLPKVSERMCQSVPSGHLHKGSYRRYAALGRESQEVFYKARKRILQDCLTWRTKVSRKESQESQESQESRETCASYTTLPTVSHQNV